MEEGGGRRDERGRRNGRKVEGRRSKAGVRRSAPCSGCRATCPQADDVWIIAQILASFFPYL